MIYSDNDILDLYEDLLTVGAAETPEEEAKRVSEFLSECKILYEAVEILNLKGISHTFYRIKYGFISDPRILTYVLFKNRTVFAVYSSSSSVTNSKVGFTKGVLSEELFDNFLKKFYYAEDFHYDTYDDLPERLF